MSNARAVAKLVAEALDSGVENPYALGNYSKAFCKDVLDLYDPPDERGYDSPERRRYLNAFVTLVHGGRPTMRLPVIIADVSLATTYAFNLLCTMRATDGDVSELLASYGFRYELPRVVVETVSHEYLVALREELGERYGRD